ncbi:MAG TPA: hypothetical protein VLZ84_01540 [Asticcacaulis sp.]|nr:hypothetical protein [Asticcacaulis sp.]
MADPVIVNPSVTPAQVKTIVRYALTILAPWLPKLFSGFFTPEIQAVISSDEFAGLISGASGAIIGTIMGAWGAIDTWNHKKQLVAAANAAPNSQFIVQTPAETKVAAK